MEVRFLLGPAGSGKTFECLREAREELKCSPQGLPLLFLTPKQSTYQIERELLSDPDLPGYTRLQVAGFEAIAGFILGELSGRKRVLDEHGRVMVLRALLSEHHSRLRVYHANAQLPGFARELSSVLRELQQAGLTPEQLRLAATRDRTSVELCDKLLDLTHILEAYQKWLGKNALYDPHELLGLAAAALANGKNRFRLGALWLDGFAELTAQELEFLAALVRVSEQATLAFCVDDDSATDWHSLWNIPARTVEKCRQRLESLPDASISVRRLHRSDDKTRFTSPTLRHLERYWDGADGGAPPTLPVEIFKCSNPVAEATTCARQILKFVQSGQGRFRDVAVVMRSLQPYDEVLRRTFTRYDIPFFIDRREPVAHHPMLELMRYALRLPANDWQQEDWFGSMKTGRVVSDSAESDRFENYAREKGWRGAASFEPLQAGLESFRRKVVEPLEHFADSCADKPSGTIFASAFRELFNELGVAERLQEWASASAQDNPEIHKAVWQSVDDLLENIALAFGSKSLPLAEWVDVLEAALVGLSVGVIPPALDQVVIGAVDRSRNPDLKMTIVMGLNEGVFPPPPAHPGLFSEYDREVLRASGLAIDGKSREQLGREQYLAYIACTRAREKLVLTYCERDSKDKPLNQSSILEHIRSIVPTVEENDFGEIVHWCELLPSVLANSADTFATMPFFKEPLEQWRWSVQAQSDGPLPRMVAEQLYGKEFTVSISKLEDYAACAFKFFVVAGLRADERKQFEIDRRLSGQFQHEVLRRFQEQLKSGNIRWREVSPDAAAERIARIGREVQKDFDGGILLASSRSKFHAQALLQRLQRLVSVLVSWARHYEFEPQAAELSFGGAKDALPAWELDLEGGAKLRLCGRIDRVDVDPVGGWTVVIDYKTSGQKVDQVRIFNGLDLQLLGYLAALRHLPNVAERFGVGELRPAGGFYVNLRGRRRQAAKNRVEALEDAALYQHNGRFRVDLIQRFDASGAKKGEQFSYERTGSGVNRQYRDPVEGAAFDRLILDTENLIREFGNEIFSGIVNPNPYRYGDKTPCQWCDYRPVCRFDPWVQNYRALRKVKETDA